VREELKDGFTDIKNMEKALSLAEADMNKDPQNMKFIETYTSLLEQFHTIG